MTGGQRRPSFDLTLGDSAFLVHELGSIDPRQLTSSQRQKDLDPIGGVHDGDGEEESSSLSLSSSSTPAAAAAAAEEEWTRGDVRLEARLFLELAGVSSMMNIGFVSSPLLTASYIGRGFSPVYLSAFTLANLTGNLSTFALLAGMFSASDTLSPQAFGRGDFPEVGRVAIRGVVASACLLVPINAVLFCCLEDIMVALGQDAEASRHAGRWYKIFVFQVPFGILYNCLWKFLTAQHIMKPLILVSITSVCLILPLSLNVCIRSMGFLGSAVGYVIFQASQALILLWYVWRKQPHEPETWKGLSLKIVAGAVEWSRMKEFVGLGMGGILAQCEWIFWEALGLVVGRLGVVALSVHTIPNQTIMAFCMVPFSFGVALAIRMGISLPVSVRRTQAIVVAATVFSAVLFGLFSVGVCVFRDRIVGLFTTDGDVTELAEVVWTKVSLFNMNVAVFAICTGIATGLGKQWPLGVINFVFLWLFGLPMIYYTAVVLDRGLDAVWFWMNIPYLCMNIALTGLFLYADWHKIREQILLPGSDTEQQDIEPEANIKDQLGETANETTPLLL